MKELNDDQEAPMSTERKQVVGYMRPAAFVGGLTSELVSKGPFVYYDIRVAVVECAEDEVAIALPRAVAAVYAEMRWGNHDFHAVIRACRAALRGGDTRGEG